MPAHAYANTALDTNYGVKASNGTMGILLEGTKVLIIHRLLKSGETREKGTPDTWSFPGGGLESDETPEQCIVREMKEELAVDVAIRSIGDEEVWGTTDDHVDNKLWRCSFFVVQQTNPEQVIKINEPNKHVAFKWIEWAELWTKIREDIEGRDEQLMRFFPTMKNMVLKYVTRGNPACLSVRLA
ncbi:NUDIX hydrolase domain-like protein [Microdochium bolleyi]|uniref:NUDIX hydrolase domain-like protein n=1 Tax=Microdochium bolleyi TaxID=196109 RepID=A0A136IK71_9PEZI|nr:NUDIX hydrolase domain-like protein [Microdochium bolleyi]